MFLGIPFCHMTHAADLPPVIYSSHAPDVKTIVNHYDPSTNKHIYDGTPRDVILKRVNSMGYHHYRDHLKKTTTMTVTERNQAANEFGTVVANAWQAKFP